MKTLIVDDETHVRKAIRLLVRWDEHGIDHILEAENGEEAIRLIQEEKPQIVLLDMMMPVKNGVDLMEWISREIPATKMIVISGHDDFEFVRHTIQYGGMDYLLKPIQEQVVNEVVARAVSEWKTEESERIARQRKETQVHQFKSVYAEKLLTNLIDDPASQSVSLRHLQHDCGFPREIGRFRLALLQVPDSPGLYDRLGDQDLVFFALINICNEFLDQPERGLAFRHWGAPGEIILLAWKQLDRFPSLLADINEGIYRTLQERVHFYLGGSEGAFPGDMPRLYGEALAAWRGRNLLKPHLYIHQMPDREEAAEKSVYFADFEEACRLAVLSGRQEEMEAAVDRWIDTVKDAGVLTPVQLEEMQHDFAAFRSRLVHVHTGERADEYLERLEKKDDPPGLRACPFSLRVWREYWLDQLEELSAALLSYQSQKQHIIFDIAKYVEQHYHEDLSLQDISARFFVSREYISRKFKQQFGINLTDYLGRIRIDRAKKLMMNPHLPIAEIARMVGYQDEKYFSKVFKKTEGMAPNEYRKQLQM